MNRITRMTKTFKKQSLTDQQKKKFQRRLSHFFRDYRYRNGLMSKDVAKILGYTPPKFYDLESESRPHGRFINSLDFLATIAALESKTLSEFVAYLEGKQDRFEEEEGTDLIRKLYAWEKALLEAFDPLSTVIRKEFVEFCKKSSTEGKEKLELMIELMNELQSKDDNTIKTLLETVRGLSK